MKYPKHLFLTFGSYESQWWTREDRFTEKLNCTARDRAEVLQFSFAASHHPSLPGDVRYSYVVSKHREAYINCYDATFVLALALNKTIAGTHNIL